MLTIDRLKELLDYDHLTGDFLWKKKRNGGYSVGAIAGCKTLEGYWQLRIDNKSYKAHRVAWFFVYGIWPRILDHIDHDKLNNRIINLREVTTAENGQNQIEAQAGNKNGFLGVDYHKSSRKFRAHIMTNRKRKFLGSFLTAEEAHEAYIAAKREVHSTCTI
ncbi:MAG: HNH endonuclease [Gallionella sp.]